MRIVADAPTRSQARPTQAALPDWRALVLGLGGMLLAFAAPAHRPDLLAIGLIATAIAIIWRPLVGPVLIGVSLPTFFFSRTLAGPLSVSPPGLALMLTWLAVAVRYRHVRLRWPRSGYDVPLALLLAASLLSLAVTQYPLLSVRDLRALIFEPVLFFWLLMTWPASRRWALAGFVTGACLTALAAIAQGVSGIGGTEVEGVLRVQAWYPSANHLALMLGRAWAFVLAGALAWRRWMWLPCGLLGLALLLTFSTGGWLGTLAASLVVLLALGYRRLAIRTGSVAVALLVVVSGLAILGALPERLNPLRQTGGFRLDLWISSLEMLRDHPLLGVGLDNFVYLYQQVYLREGAAAEPTLSHPHNWILNFWLSLGIVGLIAFVWLVVRFWRQARFSKGWLVAGALGAIADMLVHGFIDNSYFLVDLAFVFWMCLAIGDQPSAIRESSVAPDS
jgi:putative inorganic carbon (HCO3(-)) transporter